MFQDLNLCMAKSSICQKTWSRGCFGQEFCVAEFAGAFSKSGPRCLRRLRSGREAPWIFVHAPPSGVLWTWGCRRREKYMCTGRSTFCLHNKTHTRPRRQLWHQAAGRPAHTRVRACDTQSLTHSVAYNSVREPSCHQPLYKLL